MITHVLSSQMLQEENYIYKLQSKMNSLTLRSYGSIKMKPQTHTLVYKSFIFSLMNAINKNPAEPVVPDQRVK